MSVLPFLSFLVMGQSAFKAYPEAIEATQQTIVAVLLLVAFCVMIHIKACANANVGIDVEDTAQQAV